MAGLLFDDFVMDGFQLGTELEQIDPVAEPREVQRHAAFPVGPPIEGPSRGVGETVVPYRPAVLPLDGDGSMGGVGIDQDGLPVGPEVRQWCRCRVLQGATAPPKIDDDHGGADTVSRRVVIITVTQLLPPGVQREQQKPSDDKWVLSHDGLFFQWLIILIRHLELPVVLVAVGEGEGNNITTRIGDVEVHAVGGGEGVVVHRDTRRGGDVDGHFAEVLGEDNGKHVTGDGGLNGGFFGLALNMCLLNGYW